MSKLLRHADFRRADAGRSLCLHSDSEQGENLKVRQSYLRQTPVVDAMQSVLAGCACDAPLPAVASSLQSQVVFIFTNRRYSLLTRRTFLSLFVCMAHAYVGVNADMIVSGRRFVSSVLLLQQVKPASSLLLGVCRQHPTPAVTEP